MSLGLLGGIAYGELPVPDYERKPASVGTGRGRSPSCAKMPALSAAFPPVLPPNARTLATLGAALAAALLWQSAYPAHRAGDGGIPNGSRKPEICVQFRFSGPVL